MSDDEGSFDYCNHEWELIFSEGEEIGKHCNKCNATLGAS